MNYWLMKSEPTTYSIDQLQKDKKTYWEGVRNYQARNIMRDQIKKGDQVLFYHSNAEPPGVAGIAKVAKEAYPDPSQFDKTSQYYDAKSTPEKPQWFCVEIQFVKKFKQLIPLEQLKSIGALHDMPLLQRGQRLSVQPVSLAQWKKINQLVL